MVVHLALQGSDEVAEEKLGSQSEISGGEGADGEGADGEGKVGEVVDGEVAGGEGADGGDQAASGEERQE